MKRVRTILRVLRDVFPLTWLGVLVAAGSAFAYFEMGQGEIDMIFFAAGLLGLAVAGLSFVLTLLTALVLFVMYRRVTSSASDLKLECGYPTNTGFSIPRLWFIPFIELRWSWLEPPARVKLLKKGFRLYEEALPTGRGQRDEIVRRFEVGDVFGLTRMAFTSREARGLQVLPSVGGLKAMHVVRSLSGGDEIPHPEGKPEGERIDIRHYVPGDPIKYVLWKVFAKNRELVVRTPERALSSARQTVAYLVAADGDEPAAGAARVAVDVGAFAGEWKFGADGVNKMAANRNEAMEVLAQSGEATEEDSGAGLGTFLSQASPDASGRSVVFVPGVPGPWLDRVLASAKSFSSGGGCPIEFVVSTDGIDHEKRPSLMRRIAFRGRAPEPKAEKPVMADGLAEVVEKLASLRTKVLILDRRDGRVYSQEHYRRSGASKERAA